MVRICLGTLGFGSACFVDEFVGREATQPLEVATGMVGVEKRLDEGECGNPGWALDQLSEGELARPVDDNDEVELSFGRLHLDDVDVSEAEPATGSRAGQAAIRYDLNALLADLLPFTWGRREMRLRCRQRCSEDRGH